MGVPPRAPSSSLNFFSIPSTATFQPTLSNSSFSPTVSVSREDVSREDVSREDENASHEDVLVEGSSSTANWTEKTSGISYSTFQIPRRVTSSAALQRSRSHGRNRDLYRPAISQKIERRQVKKGVQAPKLYPEHNPLYYLHGATGYGSVVHAVASGMQGTSMFSYTESRIEGDSLKEQFRSRNQRTQLGPSALDHDSHTTMLPLRKFSFEEQTSRMLTSAGSQISNKILEKMGTKPQSFMDVPVSSTGLFGHTPSRFDQGVAKVVCRHPPLQSRSRGQQILRENVEKASIQEKNVLAELLISKQYSLRPQSSCENRLSTHRSLRLHSPRKEAFLPPRPASIEVGRLKNSPPNISNGAHRHSSPMDFVSLAVLGSSGTLQGWGSQQSP